MSRPTKAKNPPHVDMTAMCDVAFLLLSFFILATKLKPAEPVPVTTPSSVSEVVAPGKNVVQISLNKDGKVYLAMQDKDQETEVLHQVNESKNLGLTDGEIQNIVDQELIAVPFDQLKQQAAMQKAQITDKLPGIPVGAAGDTANNQLITWMESVNDVYLGKPMNLLLKGDDVAKYPAFKGIVDALTKNSIYKFAMVTNPEAIPAGTALWEINKNALKK